MTAETTERRTPAGTYPKGEQTRARIVRVAAELFAEKGYTSGSMREIATRAGLAQAGLRHHFPDKFELFIEVLRMRDASLATALQDADPAGERDTLEAIVRHNTEQPGLTALYRVLSAEAGDPGHPAHDYFRTRYRDTLAEATRRIRGEQQRGAISDERPADVIATAAVALMDGLQIQSALVDGFDPIPTVREFVRTWLSPR